MKVLTTAIGAVSFLLASSALVTPASAFGLDEEGCLVLPYFGKLCVPEVPVDCEVCDDDALSIKQWAFGWQEAYNNMYDIGSATDVTQSALNAINLINLDGLVDLNGDPVAIGVIDQDVFAGQVADNDLVGDPTSSLYNVVQTATNLMNSISGTTMTWAEQDAKGYQSAANYLVFGKHGYDADDDFEDATQAAANLANLISVDELSGGINQYANVSQTAINTAVYDTYGWGWYTFDSSVYDFEQSATNVVNSISIPAIDPLTCDCLENLGLDAQIIQGAKVDQLAVNNLYSDGYYFSGLIDVTNITQSATNLANSIGMPSEE